MKIGTHVVLDRKQETCGIVSEIVHANSVPRTVPHRASWRRPVESYVVTILAPRTIRIRSKPGARFQSLGCRRVWPDPETIHVRTTGGIHAA